MITTMTKAMILSVAVGLSLPASADPTNTAAESADVPVLHVKAARELVDKLEHQHYNAHAVDDEISSRLIDTYLNKLDPQHIFLLRSDIAEFEKYRNDLDDQLRRGDSGASMAIFQRFRQRATERWQKAIDTMPATVAALKFDGDDYLDLRRDAKSPWPVDAADSDALWYPRLKNTVLELRLTGKNNEEIVQILTQRYRRQANRAAKMTDDDAFEIYMNALLALYDPHSNFFGPRIAKNFNIDMSLKLVGIGLVLRADGDYTEVVRAVPAGPAAKQGELRPGDRIVAIGEGKSGEMKNVVGWSLDDVVDLMRGPRGSSVRLDVLPGAAGAPDRHKSIELVRNDVQLEEQTARKEILVFEQNGQTQRLSVITLPSLYIDFDGMRRGDKNYRSSTRDVQKLVAESIAENVQGIVLDLRDNGGGSLMEATALGGLFIDSGPMVQIRGADGKIFREGKPRSAPYYDGPLAVLINRESASGTEILTGALQDYQRALVIGDLSFGAGSVQQFIQLSYGDLKLTQSKLYRVSGDSIQLRGVAPDIVLPSIYDASEIGEQKLENPLAADQIASVPHRVYFNFAPALPELLAKHQQRVGGDAGYQLLQARQTQRAPARLSLNEAVRKRELAEAATQPLASGKREAAATGLADPLLAAAAHILVDATASFTPAKAVSY